MNAALLLAAVGGEDPALFMLRVGPFLTWYYVALAALNAFAAYYLWHHLHRGGAALFWATVAIIFGGICAPLAATGAMRLPQPVIDFSNVMLSGARGAIVYNVGTLVVLLVLFYFRRFFVQPMVAWTMLNLSLLFLGLAMVDQNFFSIVSKGDNIPIVGLVYLLGFFTWLATYRAVINDDRIARGEVPLEKLDDEKVLVWPDLVYTELICMVALTAFLIVWSIVIPAPLEQPASRVKTPNPSKAPWYFLGLQEMLVYYDPWFAGVVAPSLIIVGLMAIPYIDFNKKGQGYYTINERKFAYLNFQFGFLVLWVTLIVMGTVLRGPNWNFFGPFEPWDAHKVEAMNNIHISQIFWIDLLNMSPPKAPPDSGFWTTLGYILLRESPGLLFMFVYLVFIPPLLAIWSTSFRTMYQKMGFIRYMVMTNLLLMMLLFPIKMVLRWSFSLKYIVNIDEWFLNF
jgi:hypothetical protein